MALTLAIPVFHLTGAERAAEFYVGRLGFVERFAYRADPARPDPCYRGVTRDAVEIHLSSFPGDGVVGGVAYLLVDDVDALRAELVARGVTIALPPTDQTWGNREMYVADPNGNTLRFVQPTAGH